MPVPAVAGPRRHQVDPASECEDEHGDREPHLGPYGEPRPMDAS